MNAFYIPFIAVKSEENINFFTHKKQVLNARSSAFLHDLLIDNSSLAFNASKLSFESSDVFCVLLDAINFRAEYFSEKIDIDYDSDMSIASCDTHIFTECFASLEAMLDAFKNV